MATLTVGNVDAGPMFGYQEGAHVPGYTGHIPAMRTHVHGQTYAKTTVNARTASELLREGLNPSGLEELVDRRPQGRNFLYAQCTSKGATMYRDGTLAAPPPSYQLPTRQTASLPALSFQAREFVGRKVPSEAIPTTRKLGNRQIPGYTGHIHGMQHVYGTSFGELSAALRASALDTTRSSLNLVGYGEFKPQAPPLQGEGERIPGYTGHIPAKDRHIYAHTYGQSTRLARDAVGVQRQGLPASMLPELVDHRPQGRCDLYTQKRSSDLATTSELRDRTGMIPPHYRNSIDRFELAASRAHKSKHAGRLSQSAHCLPGYTGHIHGDQHVYGITYGKMTGSILEHGVAKPVTPALLKYEDTRPQRQGGMAIKF